MRTATVFTTSTVEQDLERDVQARGGKKKSRVHKISTRITADQKFGDVFGFGWRFDPSEPGAWSINRCSRLYFGIPPTYKPISFTLKLCGSRDTTKVQVFLLGEKLQEIFLGTQGEEITLDAEVVSIRRKQGSGPIVLDFVCDDHIVKERQARRFRLDEIVLELSAPSRKRAPLPWDQKKVINFVTGKDLGSSIFEHLFNYFSDHLSDRYELVVTESPLENADIYHYHRLHLIPMKDIERPAICTIHHDLRDIDPWLDINKFLPRFRKMDAILTMSRDNKEILERKYNFRNVHLLPHGYNQDVLSPSGTASKKNGKVVLGVFSKRYGRKVKGESSLEEMYRRLAPDEFDWVFVGPGREVDYKICKDLGFRPKLFISPPYNLFRELYESISALVVYSHFEGGPACVPEAVAMGVPILCHPTGMAKDMVHPEENGLFLSHVPLEDQKVFERLAREDGLIERMSRRCLELKSEVPTWEQVVGKYQEIVETLVKD